MSVHSMCVRVCVRAHINRVHTVQNILQLQPHHIETQHKCTTHTHTQRRCRTGPSLIECNRIPQGRWFLALDSYPSSSFCWLQRCAQSTKRPNWPNGRAVWNETISIKCILRVEHHNVYFGMWTGDVINTLKRDMVSRLNMIVWFRIDICVVASKIQRITKWWRAQVKSINWGLKNQFAAINCNGIV